jgi:radical SAM protein with 4Fe4S-binding SPASM domain
MCLRENIPNEDMLPEVIEQVIPLSRHIGEMQLYGYGEPLIATRFDSLVSRLDSARLSFTTNGLALTPARLTGILSEARRPVSSIVFSIDAATPDTYESIRRGSRFDQVVRNLAYLDTYRREHGRKVPRTEIAFVAMHRNVRELADLVLLAGRSGVSHVHVAHVVVWDESNRNESLLYHPDEMKRAFEDAERAASAVRVKLNLPALISLGETRKAREVRSAVPKCYMPWRHPVIKYNGDVQPCCAAPDLVMGNVLEEPFSAIWNGPEFRAFRGRVNASDPPSVCRTCDVRFRDLPHLDQIEEVYIRPPPANR